MYIESESESEDELPSVSVDIVGTELDSGGRSDFASASDPVVIVISSGKGGTGGGGWEASIGGGGGAKGGNLIEIGTLRTCRKMAEAYAGQMAEINFICHDSVSCHRLVWKMK